MASASILGLIVIILAAIFGIAITIGIVALIIILIKKSKKNND